MIAPAYARKYPNRVISLGLLSTAAGRTKEDRSKLFNVIKSMEKNGIPNILNTLKSRWFTNEFIANNPEIVKQRIKQVINTNPRVFLNVFRIYANTEMFPWLKELLIPTLVLTGENDGACNPRLNKLIADTVPTSKLVILPNYKHSILIEAPTEISENLIQFMQ